MSEHGMGTSELHPNLSDYRSHNRSIGSYHSSPLVGSYRSTLGSVGLHDLYGTSSRDTSLCLGEQDRSARSTGEVMFNLLMAAGSLYVVVFLLLLLVI